MTTKTDITQERADFETAYASAYPTAAARPDKFDREDWGDYVDTSVGIGWRMWQAGRAAGEADRQGRMPSDEELLKWAGEEQFFLFCDEDEFLQIAREVLSRYSDGQPNISDLQLQCILQVYDDALDKAREGRVFDNPGRPGSLEARAWDAGTRRGKELGPITQPAASAEPAVWVAADTLYSAHPTCISSLAYMSQIDHDRGREYVPLAIINRHAAPVAQEPVSVTEHWQDGDDSNMVSRVDTTAPVAAQAQPSISLNDDDLDRVATILNRHEAEEIGLWGVVEEIMDAFGERFLANASTPDHWQSVAELLHARGYVQSAGDIGRVARLLGSVRPDAQQGGQP